MSKPYLRLVGLAFLLCGEVTTSAQGTEFSVARNTAVSTTVAVFPFDNITGDASDQWIGEGIAEALTADLQRLSSLEVIGRELNASGSLSGGRPSAAANSEAALEFGRRVNAQWIVSGGYQRLGDRIRITGRFVDVSTGTLVRTAKVDGGLDELFTLQDQLAVALIGRQASSVRFEPASRPDVDVVEARSAKAKPAPVQTSAELAVLDSPSLGEPGEVAEMSSTAADNAAIYAFIDGPLPPVPPEVITHDDQGRATVRAIKLTREIRLDGRLDEEVYKTVVPIDGFIQQVPDEGAPASEQTEAWIMFDGTNVYVSARCYDSAPPSEWVANEMRRDLIRQNDTFGVMLDTFYDRRNGVMFYANPLGAISDFGITNEGNANMDWNPVWDVRTDRFEGGWTIEMQIPFKSLRYQPGAAQLWGVQLRRVVRRRNEASYITSVPLSATTRTVTSGAMRVSLAATLVGIEPPLGSNNFEIKAYGIGGVTTDLDSSPPTRNQRDANGGFDVKYGITENLTADFTYNTDFAQVEMDENQVNLTRFSLFFPEKREFFLEGRGIFGFARGNSSAGSNTRGGVTPTMFFSRRIGLQSGQVVPIIGGGRVTGKIGNFDVGAINIQTDDESISGSAAENFTVVRVKRDILRRSSVGAMFTNRSVSPVGDGSNQLYGADATFAFYENVSVLGYFARTQTAGISGADTSYQARVSYGGDRYGLNVDHLVVEDNFVPGVGYLRRDNMRRTFLSGRFSPRPRSIELVRKFTLLGSLDYILTADKGLLETRQQQLGLETEFENSDRLQLLFNQNYELLTDPFEISDGMILPVGGYAFKTGAVSYALGQHRRANGAISFEAGEFWNGHIKKVEFNRGRVALTPRFSIEPSLSLNWVDLPEESFLTELARARVSYAFNPRMFLSGLMQYSSRDDSLSMNLRLRWEYSPGSELFVVYTEELDTDPLFPDRYTDLRNRGLAIKVSRLFRY